MSCNSAIYTVNSSDQAVGVNGIISLGSTIRRFGKNINLVGNAINISGSGYFDVDASITITGTNAGTVTVSLYKDGTAVSGAEASVSLTAGDVVTVPINALVREFGCCADNNSNLTFVLGGFAETINNISVVVERI